MDNNSKMNDNYKQGIGNYLAIIGAAAVITLAPSLAMANNKPKAPEPKKEGIEAIFDGVGKLAGGAFKLVYDTTTGIIDGTRKFIGNYLDNSFNNYESLDYCLFDKEGKDPLYGITHKPGNFVRNWLDLGYTIVVGWPSESMKRAKAEKAAEGKAEEKGPVLFVVDTARFLKQATGVAGEAAWNTPGDVANGLREKPLDLIVDGFGGYVIGDLISNGPLTGGDGNGKGGLGEVKPPLPPFPKP